MVQSQPEQPARPYHHGDLRRALLDAAIDVIAEAGPTDMSLRDLARRVGVSHAAPTHHFGDKTGLLTAVAVDGYQLLAAALADTWDRTGSFLEVGVSYVGFAVTHRSHFEVMFRPELYRSDDPDLCVARASASESLYGPAAETAGSSGVEAGVAAWSLVHGVASLWLNGLLPPQLGDDPEAIARAMGHHLFGGLGASARDGGRRRSAPETAVKRSVGHSDPRPSMRCQGEPRLAWAIPPQDDSPRS